MFNLSSKNRGFTLIETIVTILVVTVGVLAAYIVTQEIISYTHQVSSRLTAAYLAKEGIEIVRNIRDTNWLQPADNWNDGLVGVGAEDWEADYTTATFKGTTDNNCSASGYNCRQCSSPCEIENLAFIRRIDGSFYNYTSGNPTKFKRKITITPIGADNLTVSVSVWWVEKGETYGPITVQEILYNWNP